MNEKKSFRGLLVAGALVVGTAALVLPAQAEHPHGRGEHFDRMVERLELEDDQVDLVREILEDSRSRAREIREEGMAEGRAALEALREETEARLSGVLTPAQMAELESLREEGQDRRRFRRRMHREAAFEELTERLELADSQIEPVREILQDSMARGREAMQAAREAGGDRETMRARVREEMDAIRASTVDQLSAVLTPAQVETFIEFQAQRREERPRRHRLHQPGQG